MALKWSSAESCVRIHHVLRTDMHPPSVPGLGDSSSHSPQALCEIRFSSIAYSLDLAESDSMVGSEETHLFVCFCLFGFFNLDQNKCRENLSPVPEQRLCRSQFLLQAFPCYSDSIVCLSSISGGIYSISGSFLWRELLK